LAHCEYPLMFFLSSFIDVETTPSAYLVQG
jgi:hypothetical protein